MKAYGKLNLTLDVLGMRDDGYHDISSVMQTVSLSDEITVTTGQNEWSIVSENPLMPRDSRNLAMKAAIAFCKKAGIDTAMTISIDKKIPIFAGLGGGSADAAAVLLELDQIYNSALDRQQLEELALEIGSDVPFFLYGGTCLVEGRGQLVRAAPRFPDCWFVICKPDMDMSAGQMYGLLDRKGIQVRPDNAAFLGFCADGDLPGACGQMVNVFEPLAAELCSDIPVIRQQLLHHGALAATLTGKGPSVFGVFDDEGQACLAYKELKRSYNNTYLAKNV